VIKTQKPAVKISLGVKFISMMVIILSLTMGISAYLTYIDNKKSALDALLNQAKSNSQFLAKVSQEAILSKDYITLNNYTSSISLVGDIIYGVILSKNGLPLSYFINNENEYVSRVVNKNDDVKILNVLSKLNRNENISRATFPVMFSNEKIAEIVIGIDHSRLFSLAKKDLINQLKINASIIFILSIFIFIIFKYNALEPLRELIKGAERIADGDLGKDVTVRSSDEIGVLAQVFNLMMQQLKRSILSNESSMDKLKFLNKTLELRIKERTGRLELAQRIAHMGHWDIASINRQINVSNEIYNILGFSDSDDISLQKILKMVDKTQRRDLITTYKSAVKNKQGFETEFEINRNDGSKRYISIIAEVEMDDNYGVVLFGVLQDITERKESEKSEHIALIEKMDAESANKAKSAFLANMSHEIRTPLTAIIGFSESMLTHKNFKRDEESIETILRNGKHLLAVINEILDLSKIESANLEVELIRTNLFKLIKDVTHLMQLQAMEKGLEFSVNYNYPIPIFIKTDPTRLKQVLLNLCSNAIKFTEKGFVKIDVSYSTIDNNIDIIVNDSGVGISASQLERLFKPFAQADSTTTRKFGGTGLGLYISRELVKKMGGDVYVESMQGVGTKLKFNIKTGDIIQSEIATSRSDVNKFKEKDLQLGLVPELVGKILLAEDSEDNQGLFKLFITITGATVDIASDGIEAVELAERGHYDLILMDIQMPRMDGLEATKKIIQQSNTTPIVALTANAMKEDKKRCQQAGCVGFLSKPVDRDEFYKILSEYLSIKKNNKDNDTINNNDNEIDSALDLLRVKFIDRLDGEVILLSKALDKQDWVELKSILHKLKGSAASFGLPNVSRQAETLETLIKKENFNEIPIELKALTEMCHYAKKTKD